MLTTTRDLPSHACNRPRTTHTHGTGLVLAADGKKMSKRLKNYPPPDEILSKYGADALRLYLISSPVVRAEPLRFKEEDVLGMIKRVFLPWINAFRFFQQVRGRKRREGEERGVACHQQTPCSPHHPPLSNQKQSVARLEMEKGDGQPFQPDPQAARASTNVMDVWIQASLQVRWCLCLVVGLRWEMKCGWPRRLQSD